MRPLISVVVPVYFGESFIQQLVERTRKTILSLDADYEIILVNDDSPDNSWDLIIKECTNDKNVKGITLSRNFGQHYAISAGLDHAKGDWIVVMDCDLQDVPEEIPKLYKKALEGFEIVYAKRLNRNDNFFKKLTSRFFYSILGYLTETKQDPSIANFGIYKKETIQAFCQLKESSRNFNTMIRWIGFKSSAINVIHQKRSEGITSYSFGMLSKLALDTILSFSDKPLRLTVKFGFLISFITIIIGIFYFVQYLSGKITVLGYTSLILSIWFLSGLIISVLGMVGLYIGRIFENVKRRPIYLVRDKIGFE